MTVRISMAQPEDSGGISDDQVAAVARILGTVSEAPPPEDEVVFNEGWADNVLALLGSEAWIEAVAERRREREGAAE